MLGSGPSDGVVVCQNRSPGRYVDMCLDPSGRRTILVEGNRLCKIVVLLASSGGHTTSLDAREVTESTRQQAMARWRREYGWFIGALAALAWGATGATADPVVHPTKVSALLLSKADAPPGWTRSAWTSTNPYRVSLVHTRVYIGVTAVTEFLVVYATAEHAQQGYNTLWAPPTNRLKLGTLGVRRTGFHVPFAWTIIPTLATDARTPPRPSYVYQAFDDAWFLRGRYVVQLNVTVDIPPSANPAAKEAWAQSQGVAALRSYAQLIDRRIIAQQ